VSSPLEGIRVLAISQFGAGPYATMMLAELGAEIIKIEDPSVGGDISRSVPPYVAENDSLYFQSFNRNKKSLTLNVKSPEGHSIFHRLVQISDALFNNLRGDQIAKLGLDYESLKQVNPKIVCCSLVGFGTTGTRSHEPGYDYLMQAYAGYMSLTGDPAGPPATCGVSVIDHAAGFAAALGLVAALYSARATGVGRNVEVSLLDTAVSMLTYLAVWNLNRDHVPVRHPGSAHQTLVPVQTFQTRDGHLVIFCAKEKFWQELCVALEIPEISADPRFKDFACRHENRQTVVATLQKIFSTRTTCEWMTRLQGKVPCAPVNDLPRALADPFLVEREMIVETEHPVFGRVKQVAGPIKVSDARTSHRPAPSLGEHTVQVLRECLGYSETEIAELKRKRIV
jgi:crotonobetainyl-CoA:carnitine CoA-transferase CaiB-like acyl-CoA transferase